MADQILSDASIALVKAANLPISLRSVELIVAEEDTSENFYHSHYEDPEWPGGASGVTIMLGYDLGYASKQKIIDDLRGKIPDAMLQACLSVSGLTGSRAAAALSRVKNAIRIPFTVALDVFLHTDMPEWIATVRHYLPNTELLPPDCLGILVSLAYNRGPSFNNAGDRYREMRAIKADMVTKNFADIPNQLRLMARLWTGGVHDRRFREASLFAKGFNRWVQQSLNKLGEQPPLVEDGDAGSKTQDAVKRFEVAHGITPSDGIAGGVTVSKLAELLAAQKGLVA